MERQESSAVLPVQPRVYRLEAAVATHIGRRRTNADAALLDETAGLYAVADAMGDRPRSSAVAQTALEAVRDLFLAPWTTYSCMQRPVEEAGERLLLGVEQAHSRVYAPWTPFETRIGTTLAAVVLCGDLLCAGRIGDSRVYLLRGSKGRLAQLGEDHTLDPARRDLSPTLRP